MAEAGRRRRFSNLAVSGSNRPETSHLNNPYGVKVQKIIRALPCLPAFLLCQISTFPINIKIVDEREKMTASNSYLCRHVGNR